MHPLRFTARRPCSFNNACRTRAKGKVVVWEYKSASAIMPRHDWLRTVIHHLRQQIKRQSTEWSKRRVGNAAPWPLMMDAPNSARGEGPRETGRCRNALGCKGSMSEDRSTLHDCKYSKKIKKTSHHQCDVHGAIRNHGTSLYQIGYLYIACIYSLSKCWLTCSHVHQAPCVFIFLLYWTVDDRHHH